MRIFNAIIATVFVAVLLWAVPGTANVEPDSTRYSYPPDATLGAVVSFAADADTVIWFGFRARQGMVVRGDANIIVDPLEADGTITDGPAWSPKYIYANPRDGDRLYAYDPDTLTALSPKLPYCCGGLLGFRIQALGMAGTCRVYATVSGDPDWAALAGGEANSDWKDGGIISLSPGSRDTVTLSFVPDFTWINSTGPCSLWVWGDTATVGGTPRITTRNQTPAGSAGPTTIGYELLEGGTDAIAYWATEVGVTTLIIAASSSGELTWGAERPVR